MRGIKSGSLLVLIPLLALFLTVVAPPPSSAEEAKMYAVTRWNAGCGGSTRTQWDDMADAWYDEITNSGFSFWGICWWGHCGDAFSRDGRMVNGNIVNSLFADTSRVNWGNDTMNLDEADAALIALHGSDSSSRWSGTLRVNETGTGDCSIRTDEMEIGDSDLEFLHLSSCHSMEDNMWGNWEQSMARMHQVDGFHGLMWIASWLVDDYRDFANDAFDGSISGAWLDNMYYSNTFNNGADDQCPVAYAVGSNAIDSIIRLITERYNNVYNDPPDSSEDGSNTIWSATYISGCNPAGEDTINP